MGGLVSEWVGGGSGRKERRRISRVVWEWDDEDVIDCMKRVSLS